MNLLFPKAALLIVLDIKKSYWVMDVRDYTLDGIRLGFKTLRIRGHQFKKVFLLRTFFNRFWPKCN